ncbi:homeodomain-containing protein [Tanacetum coccineum]
MSLVLKAQVATLDEGTGSEKDADISSEIVLMKRCSGAVRENGKRYRGNNVQEKILSPGFLDHMEHLLVHLSYEEKVGGPVQYRWMYPFERYLYHLKKKVKNKIDVNLKGTSLSVFNYRGRPSGTCKRHYLDDDEYDVDTFYVLHNCEEIQPFFRIFEAEMKVERPNITTVELIDMTQQRIPARSTIVAPTQPIESAYQEDGTSLPFIITENNEIEQLHDVEGDVEEVELQHLGFVYFSEVLPLHLQTMSAEEEMSADVARGHDGDGGGDDRPYTKYHGKGTRKPNLGGRRAGRQHTCQETRNLGLKAITDKSGPVPIRFEFGDRETLMPLDPGVTCVPNVNLIAGHLSIAAIQQLPTKGSTMKEGQLDAQIAFWNGPQETVPGAAQNKQNRESAKMESSATREYPSLIHTFFLIHTVNGVFLNPEDKALYDEMLRLQGLGTTLRRWMCYGISAVASRCTHSSDVAKLKKREKMLSQLSHHLEIGGGIGGGVGAGDDEQETG